MCLFIIWYRVFDSIKYDLYRDNVMDDLLKKCSIIILSDERE